MGIDEGGIPKGSLSYYVSNRLKQVTDQEAQAKRVKDAAFQTQSDQFMQRTAPLRAHLLHLAEPIEELFVRFGVRGLLEEARDILAAHYDSVFEEKFEAGKLTSRQGGLTVEEALGHCMDYEVKQRVPRIYQYVVLDPKPTTPSPEFRVFSRRYKLDDLIEPDDFTREIPNLTGYGLSLTASSMCYLRVQDHQRIVWQGETRQHRSWSPGAGDIYDRGPMQTAWSDPTPAYDLLVKVTKSLTIMGEGAGVEKSGYALHYTHRLERNDDRDTLYSHATNQSQSIDLTKLTVIRPDQPVEILRNLVGNDVAKELAGGYKALVRQYKTKQA